MCRRKHFTSNIKIFFRHFKLAKTFREEVLCYVDVMADNFS